jgi:hypothetical protein
MIGMIIFCKNNRKDCYQILVEDPAGLYLNSLKMTKDLLIENRISKKKLDFLNTLIFMNYKNTILNWMKVKKKKIFKIIISLNCMK